MFNRKIIIAFFILLPVLLSAGGQQGRDEGAGIVYDIDNFRGIEGSGTFDIEVKQSDRYSVIIYANRKIENKLIVEKRGSTLRLGLKPFTFNLNQSPKAVITMPELEKVDLSGASSLIAAGFRSRKSFDCDISGASSVEIDITAPEVNLDLSGASDLRAVLEAEEVYVELSGSSDIELVGYGEELVADLGGASSGDLKDFPVTKADVELSGSSDLSISLKGILNLDASGASDLYYSGNVELGDIDLSGSSSMKEM